MGDILDELSTGTELAEYEKPVPLAPIKPMVWSVEKYEVAQLLATKGMNIQRVSEITEVPISAIKKWKQHPEFIKYMREFIIEEAETLRAYRLSLCLKMIDARIEKIEELGDYSMLSTKDTLDIMDAMRKDTEKDDGKEQSQYMKTLEALIHKSKPALTVNVDGGA